MPLSAGLCQETNIYETLDSIIIIIIIIIIVVIIFVIISYSKLYVSKYDVFFYFHQLSHFSMNFILTGELHARININDISDKIKLQKRWPVQGVMRK
jgi:formate hydrogenlyase subunit 3/multisubunit Na+/H+ antiporter MnhD subunit